MITDFIPDEFKLYCFVSFSKHKYKVDTHGNRSVSFFFFWLQRIQTFERNGYRKYEGMLVGKISTLTDTTKVCLVYLLERESKTGLEGEKINLH